MKAQRKDRRMAIPLEEIEASARAALGMMIMGAISLLFILFAIWATFYAIGKAEAHNGHIYAKSEMTREEIKALNVMPVKGERHAR